MLHEFILNIGTPVIVGLIFSLSAQQTILLTVGSLLVDIDHILHCLYKGVGWKEMKKYLQAEFTLHRPHIYIFHVLEVLAILIVTSYFFFPSLVYLFFGFALNVSIDIGTYLIRHRSFSPWGRFFLGSYNMIYLMKQKARVTSKTEQL